MFMPSLWPGTELHKMMTLQRDMLRDNPDAFWQQAANMPGFQEMSRAVCLYQHIGTTAMTTLRGNPILCLTHDMPYQCM